MKFEGTAGHLTRRHRRLAADDIIIIGKETNSLAEADYNAFGLDQDATLEYIKPGQKKKTVCKANKICRELTKIIKTMTAEDLHVSDRQFRRITAKLKRVKT